VGTGTTVVVEVVVEAVSTTVETAVDVEVDVRVVKMMDVVLEEIRTNS
jgi:hypothetical protein